MVLIRALATSLQIVLAIAVAASAASSSFAEGAGVRFGGPPLTLVMTVDVEERAFPAEGRATLAVADGRDAPVLRGPVPYRVSNSQLRIEQPFPAAKVPLIRDRVRVTLVVNDRRGTQRTFRAAAANPKLPVTLAANGPARPTLVAETDTSQKKEVDLKDKSPKSETSTKTGVDRDKVAPKGEAATGGDVRDKSVPRAETTKSGPADERDRASRGEAQSKASVEVTAGQGPKTPPTAAAGGAAQPRVVVRVTGSGTVSNTALGINCRERATKGCDATFKEDSATFTLAPDPGYKAFATDCTSGESQCTVRRNPTGRTEFNVTFKPETSESVPLTVNVRGGGSVRVQGAESPCDKQGCAYQVPRGQQITLTAAEPTSRLRLSDWGGACRQVQRELRCVVIPSGPTTVDATFAANPYWISVKPNRGYVVTIKPRGNHPDGICRESCEIAYQDATEVVLEARLLDEDTRETRESSQIQWSGCDSPSGATCRLKVARGHEVTAGPPTWWGDIKDVFGNLPLLLITGFGVALAVGVAGYALWRIWDEQPGTHQRERTAHDTVRETDTDTRAGDDRGWERPKPQQPWSLTPRPAHWPESRQPATEFVAGRERAPIDNRLDLEQMVRELLQQRLGELADLPLLTQSRSGTEITRAVTPPPNASDADKVAAVMNVSWKETLKELAPDRPALRQALERVGLRGDFYHLKNALDHLDSVTSLPYVFVPAPTDGNWLLVPTSPSDYWLALPLTHMAVNTQAMKVVEHLFDGWHKAPPTYRFEVAYRPCRLRKKPNGDMAFNVDDKGYFTLQGEPPSPPPPPPMPPNYEILTGTSGQSLSGARHAEPPSLTVSSSGATVEDWLKWLNTQVNDVRAALKTQAHNEAEELRRRLTYYDDRINALVASVEALTNRESAGASSAITEARITQLLTRVEQRLEDRLARAEKILKDVQESQERAEREIEAVVPQRIQLDAPARSTASSAEPLEEAARPEPIIPPSTSSQALVSFVTAGLRFFEVADDDQASADDDGYLANLCRCRDHLRRVAEDGLQLQIGVVHLDALEGDRLRFVDVKEEGKASLRCAHCTSLPGTRTYQHFISVRSNDKAAVLLPPGSVAVRNKWPRGFQLLLQKEEEADILRVAGVDHPAVLQRSDGDSFKVIEKLRLLLRPSGP